MNRYEYQEYDDEETLSAQDTGDDWQEQEGAEAVPPVPAGVSLRYGLGTFLTMGAVDLFAHLGLTGLVVGGITAYAVSRHGPEVVEHFKEALPTALPRLPVGQQGKRQRQPRCLQADNAEDTVLVEEAEGWEDWTPLPRTQRRRSPDLVVLSPTLQLPVGELAGKAICICGIRRHGKTTLGALLAEQLGRYDLPLFIPDAEGDYLSLAEVLPRAVLAGHSRASGAYPSVQFVALDDVQAAYQLGYDTLEYGYQVLLDLSSYESLDDGIAVQVNLIRGLFHWTNLHPDQRVPCHVYLDEAQRYLPQNLNDSVILHRGLLSALLKCYMDIIGTGGKRGLAPVILTQRFAQVNNKIMAQTEVFFLLRQTHDSDLDRCMEYADKTVVSKEQIARFQPGQGLYIGSDGTQIVTRFAPRRSSGERSASPRPEAAARYACLPVLPRSQHTVPAAGSALPELQPADGYRVSSLDPVRHAPAEAQPAGSRPAFLVQMPPAPPAPTLLERAVAAYLDGATSQPRLAAALDISPWEARKLMPQVEAAVKRLREQQQA